MLIQAKAEGGGVAVGLSIPPMIITATGNQTIPASMWSGATKVKIECYGSGGAGYAPFSSGGGGGAFSSTDAASLVGLTGLYVSVPTANAPQGTPGDDAYVLSNTSGGAVLCLAKGGGSSNGGTAASGTGDTKFSGGNGNTSAGGGGGAAGPNGNGAAAIGSTGGAGNGGYAGKGANAAGIGANYGGGGSYSTPTGSSQGLVVLTFT
jgi:hypothetical protein